MIEVKTSGSKDKLFIEVSGHCGKKGESIICAAASMIMQTLEVMLIKTGTLINSKTEDGYMRIELKKTPESRCCFEYCVTGFSLLQKNYPFEIKM